MTTQSADMLRALGGNMLHAHASSANGHGASALGSLDFVTLLNQARAGEVKSGLSVRVANGANVELTPEQLGRLSAAADLAEAHGSSRGAFMIDGKVIAMDVPTRTVTGEIQAHRTGIVDGIDAIVTVAAKDAKDATGTIQPPSAMSSQQPMNTSLLDALSQQSDTRVA